MSEIQEMIIETTEKIMQKYSTKEVINSAEEGQWAGNLWNQLVNNGMITVAIPEELGGNGGDHSDALCILRLAGKYAAPIPIAETYMANWILSRLGISVSEEIVTISYPDDSQSFVLNKTDDGWSISGRAKNVPWARYANKMLVFGKTTEGDVLTTVNLDYAQIKNNMNLAGEARDEVSVDNVYVEDSTVIHIDKDEQLNYLFFAGGLTRSVMMAGALESILDIVINHTSERAQFGKPLHRFQAIQQQLALLTGETAAASMAANCAIKSFETNPFSKEIALAKIRVNEAAGTSCKIAHQVLAAIGFTYEHTLHHNTRRLWSWRDENGTERDWQQIVTAELMKLDKNELWSLMTNVKNTLKKVEQ
ncbi:acyl-CoA/acyl-ACP dehydrogenase [Neobacillus niacini]|uniref:acyl-CoA dehydrogenase family protein n=1 Tax=Neobacillus niacini TaxID=86668 RepID=UPI0007AB3BC0|nr:acyl-CoA dehydrogenase family protein [Neobacillus niacini]MEC1524973.1 acyl-CoA/acyl-ACP dehydrogenase [Neobacillus niacini]